MRIDRLSARFGATTVLDNLSIEIVEHGITAVLGPSGCGKTTLLKVLGGLLQPMHPEEVSGLEAVRSRISSFLFQEPRLLPWLTAEGNVRFALPGDRSADRKAAELRAREYLGLVGLADSVDLRPSALSGGMRQRVAMARAFAYPSDILFMDEPMQGLDVSLRHTLLNVFAALWKVDRRTTIMVTHDLSEALLLGDRIIVLSKRPATVRLTMENPGTVGSRTLADTELLERQQQLYRALVDESS